MYVLADSAEDLFLGHLYGTDRKASNYSRCTVREIAQPYAISDARGLCNFHDRDRPGRLD